MTDEVPAVAVDRAEATRTNLKVSSVTAPVQLEDAWEEQDYDRAAAVFKVWMAQDPGKAFGFLGEKSPPLIPAHFGPAIQEFLEDLPRHDAMEWAVMLGFDHKLQESVTADLAAEWISESRDEALGWLNGNAQHAFVENLGQRLGAMGHFGEPEAALPELMKLSDTYFRDRAISGTVLRWLREDAEAAVVYLNNIGSQPALDRAAYDYADELLKVDRVAAMSWAETIESDSLRPMIVSQIEAEWTQDEKELYETRRAGE